MKLVYKATGAEVKVGDRVNISFREGEKPNWRYVEFFRQPTSTASQGKVTVNARKDLRSMGQEYYVSVIGAEWIEREDRAAEDRQAAVAKIIRELQVLVQPGDEKLGVKELLKVLYERAKPQQ